MQTRLIAALLFFICFRVYAQSDLNDVHVMSGTDSRQLDGSHLSIKTDIGIIRKTVELVLVPVTVMDERHRIVTGLSQNNFHLYEDKRPQSIKNFWREDEPVSVGILLDVSGSMQSRIDRARDAVLALLKSSNPEDEFFLVTFADRPSLIQDFTQNVDDIQSELVFTRPKGYTSLLDAIVMAVNNMKKARYRRKALVIISDGGDNRSRYTEKDVKSLVKEADIMVYSIAVFGTELRTIEERLGPELLASVSEVTGASAYVLDNPDQLSQITEHIALELRNQYVLGYAPAGSRHDGKWRKIKVRLALPRGIPPLLVQSRTGYYSAEHQ